MTRLLLKLHRTLWWRNVKTNMSVAVIAILIVVYSLIGLLSIDGAMALEMGTSQWHALTAAVGIGTGAYALAAMVFPNGENQIAPAQLASQPLTPRDVLPALGWASVQTSRGVAAVVCTVITTAVAAFAFGGKGHFAAALIVIPVMVVALLTTVVLGELVASFNRSGTRRGKEVTNAMTIVLGLGAIFGFNFLMGAMGQIRLATYGQYFAWTPLAAAPGALANAMNGAWWSAILQLLIATVTLLGAVYLWRLWTVRELTAPLDLPSNATDNSTTEQKSHRLLVPLAPAGPGGMIFSRALRYLRRDSRSMAGLMMVPIFAILFTVQAFLVDESLMYIGAIVIGIFVGASAVNDFGYDGPGMASYVLAAVPARTVVFARHLASIIIPLLLQVIYNVAVLLMMDNTALAAVVVAGSFGLTFASCAIGVIASVFNPYAMSRPGTNPWADKSGNNAAAYVSAFATLLVCWIPVAPGMALVAFGWPSSISMMVAGVVLILALPAVLYAGAVELASRRYATHFPEIYAKVGRWLN